MDVDKKKSKIVLGPATIFVAIAAVAAFCVYVYFTQESFSKQIENSIEIDTKRVASEIDVSVRYADASIRQISASVTSRLQQYPHENLRDLLSSLPSIAPFAQVETFSNSEVLAFGPNISQEIFKGFAGETGAWAGNMPESSSTFTLNFYTPVILNDSIIGVVVGALDSYSDLHEALGHKVFGEESVALLCDQRLNIIASNFRGSVLEDPLKQRGLKIFSNDALNLFKKNALQKTPTAFWFSSNFGMSVASVAPLKDGGWYVVQVAQYASKAANIKGVIWRTLFLVLVVVFLVAIYEYLIGKRRRKALNETEEYHLNVIKALTAPYGSVFEVNLDTGNIKPFRIFQNITPHLMNAIKTDSTYSQLVTMYVNLMVYFEDHSMFSKIMTLDSLKQELTKRSRLEFVYRVKIDGQLHHVQIHFVRPSIERSEAVVGFRVVDESMNAEIEKRRVLNEQRMALVKALDRAQKADKAKSNFLLNMSHDIRTPMNAVLGYERLAKEMLSGLNMPQETLSVFEHYLDCIQQSGSQLLDMINSVLNMARIESGVDSLDESTVYTAEISENLIATFEQAALQKKLMFQVSRNIKTKCIMADKVKLRQILLNIVSNAIKFTEERGVVRISMRDLPHEKPGMCYIEIIVEDTGVGISEEFLPKIFNEFEREKNTLTQAISGTGLGLSIVKKMVDLMHGRIAVTSRLGEGSRVTVTIPFRIAAECKMLESAELASKNKVLQGKRVLLADDDPMACEIVTEMLKKMGMEIIAVSNGVECFNALDSHAAGSFDLVLLDLKMPRMDGFETIRRIRRLEDRLKAEMPVIAISGNAFDEERNKALEAGFDSHITKPIDFSLLFRVVAEYFV